MAVSPRDIALTATELHTVSLHEKALDAALRNNFVEGKAPIRLYFGPGHQGLQKPPNDRIVNELIRRYKMAGWHDVKMDGESFVFFRH